MKTKMVIVFIVLLFGLVGCTDPTPPPERQTPTVEVTAPYPPPTQAYP